MGHIIFAISKRDKKKSEISHIWKVYRIFLFLPILMFFLLLQLNRLCWELSVVYRRKSIFYRCRDRHDRKRLKSANFQNLKVFISHPILKQFFYEVFILIGHWWAIVSCCACIVFYFKSNFDYVFCVASWCNFLHDLNQPLWCLR